METQYYFRNAEHRITKDADEKDGSTFWVAKDEPNTRCEEIKTLIPLERKLICRSDVDKETIYADSTEHRRNKIIMRQG